MAPFLRGGGNGSRFKIKRIGDFAKSYSDIDKIDIKKFRLAIEAHDAENFKVAEKIYKELLVKYENNKVIKYNLNLISGKTSINRKEKSVLEIDTIADTLSSDTGADNEINNIVTNPSNINIKKKSEIKSVLGIDAIADTLASVLVKFDDSGMMIGIFGKWGRGKTHFAEKLWESIANEQTKYKRVDFSAWKYQDTKASWAYLYEKMISVYLSDGVEKEIADDVKNNFKNKIKSFYSEKKKILLLNIQRHTWFPIISFAILFIISFTWSFFIDKSAIANYLISTFGILIIIKFIFFYLQQKPSAIGLYQKYFSKKNFEDYLGLQAEIENELVILLKRWIPKPDEDEKIVLFVDDIDRCNIEQVIDIIDGLRVILDNPEIYNRLIIVTAIDETILEKALEHKYQDGNMDVKLMYKEYLEKIFIIGIKLNSLNPKELEEILETILPDSIDSISNDTYDDTYDDDTYHHTDDKEKHSYELSEIEKNYIKEAIKKLKNATPRKIRIFYYKYLIMKKLFHTRLEEKAMISQWDEEKDEKIIIDLLIHIANDNKIDDFKHEKNKNIFEILLYTANMVSVL